MVRLTFLNVDEVVLGKEDRIVDNGVYVKILLIRLGHARKIEKSHQHVRQPLRLLLDEGRIFANPMKVRGLFNTLCKTLYGDEGVL